MVREKRDNSDRRRQGAGDRSKQKRLYKNGTDEIGGYEKKKLVKTGKGGSTVKRRSDKTEHEAPKGIRLNKFIANAGVCSRREADELIKKGEIQVNGKVITELGTNVSHSDVVKHKGIRLNAEQKVYLLLNKPKDYVTTLKDRHAKKTVMDIVGGACEERIYPVGRLDRNTTGVLLFTNDGDLAKKLTHPRHLTRKIYHVYLDKPIIASDLTRIAEGVQLEDGPVHADAISYVTKEDKTQVGIEIHSGKNRIVRRIFEHLDYKVVKLDRVYFAGLTKKGISRGQWRFLTPKEINLLKSGFWK
jgi:23S rRNA pseudouridine2605 synthase